MDSENFDLFLVLIKLKSYLISLIDEPEPCYNNLDLTEEYLERRYPEKKKAVIDILTTNNIRTDCDIVFDEQVHEKFKIMACNNQQINLLSFLQKLEIEARDLNLNTSLRSERDEKLREIIKLLFKLAKIWNMRKEIEEDVEDYSVLQEEDVLRPEEELRLINLDKITSVSFETISVITKKYIESFIDYYFSYGGDISLKRFVTDINSIQQLVTMKYSELFRKSGLEEKWIDKLSEDIEEE